MIELHHGRVRLALHERQGGRGAPLLLLHELGAASTAWPAAPLPWSGPVLALDFAGHGQSAAVRGGAYSAELLAGDADAALAHLGHAVVAGAGVGAYVALLLAGGRPAHVPAALLLPGRGLAGGGEVPDFAAPKLRFQAAAAEYARRGCDPLVAFLESDIRPIVYAARFAHASSRLLLLEDGGARPPWWTAARAAPRAERVDTSFNDALRQIDATLNAP